MLSTKSPPLPPTKPLAISIKPTLPNLTSQTPANTIINLETFQLFYFLIIKCEEV
jgi:hypothetical protein